MDTDSDWDLEFYVSEDWDIFEDELEDFIMDCEEPSNSPSALEARLKNLRVYGTKQFDDEILKGRGLWLVIEEEKEEEKGDFFRFQFEPTTGTTPKFHPAYLTTWTATN